MRLSQSQFENIYRLELGYVYLPDGRLFPVDECGFNLWDIGENGTPPRDYHFNFKAGKCAKGQKLRAGPIF